MQKLLILTLVAGVCACACGTAASDAASTLPNSGDTAVGVTAQTAPSIGEAAQSSRTVSVAAASRAVTSNTAQPVSATTSATAPRLVFRDVTIPTGTALPMTLTSSVASDTSAVEDAVTAELTRPIRIDGRDVIPAGARLTGIVTDVDESGRVKGRAMVAFRFTSLRTGNQQYDVQAAPLSRMASATKSEDATKIGIGAGAGAVIGGLLGGKKGAAEGAAVGGGAGTGVVLATKGKEIRLAPGADVTSQLTAPLVVRVRIS